MANEIPKPLPPLTAEERAIVSRLTEDQRQAIDAALLAEVAAHWRKVAMVVARAMDRATHVPGLPDTYYGQRIRALVGERRIEAQGDVEYMRSSEVRLFEAPN